LGAINFNEIEGGEAGLNYYSNLAVGKWGLLMDDFLYNNVDMTGDHKAKIALIDSGNTSIQLPATMFNNVINEIKKVDRTVFTQVVDGNTILVSRQQCKDLWSVYGDIAFTL